ncbi:MAG: hypothetical protein MUE46_20425 [Xanthomonadales bacterium]|nr:hypothetical protein [Xanthomonadales bacterium]
MERKWIWVIVTLVLALSTSFTSTSVFRGVIAPIGTLLFAFIAVMAFVQARIHANAQPQQYQPSAEERRALEAAEQKRIEAIKARQRVHPPQ